METLEILFSSRPRVEILRTFLFQPQTALTASDIAEQTDTTSSTARSHARDLVTIDLLKETTIKDVQAWKLNKSSKLRGPLHEIILLHQRITPQDITDRLRKVGRVSLLILSGIFTGAENQPVDILISGEDIDTTKLQRSLTRIEKAYGTELRYTVLTESEFNYRFNLYDKLIRNIIEYPHHVLIDDSGVTSQ